MKAVLLGCLALGIGSLAQAARKPSSNDACRAQALSATEAEFGSGNDTQVKTITAGKKYEITIRGEDDDEVTYEATFTGGCNKPPEVREVSSESGAAPTESHSHFGGRCLEGEMYHQGQCCKRGAGGAIDCPPSKPGAHRHDMPRK